METANIHDTALSAFKKLHDLRLGALGILDADGSLVTELAGTSLRWLTSSNIHLLGKPVLAYLFGLNRSITVPYVCRDGFTISQLATGLLKTRARRAWVVDRMNRPIGVITLTDILSMFQSIQREI